MRKNVYRSNSMEIKISDSIKHNIFVEEDNRPPFRAVFLLLIMSLNYSVNSSLTFSTVFLLLILSLIYSVNSSLTFFYLISSL